MKVAFLCFFGFGLLVARGEQAGRAPLSSEVGAKLSSKNISFIRSEVTPFRGLIEISRDNKIPIGIVVGKSNSLCTKPEDVDITNTTVKDALEKIVVGTQYQIDDDGGVFIVAPQDISLLQKRILTLRIHEFSPPSASMHVLGAFLAIQAENYLHPSGGVGGVIPHSVIAKRLEVPKMYNATTEEIANQLVSQDGNGIWIMPYIEDSQGTETGKTSSSLFLNVYSYDDDSMSISALSCQQ